MPALQERAFRSTSAQETRAVAAALGASLADGDVVTLSGDLGAGKTCFAQGVAEGMGIGADVVSPTFNIILTYEDAPVTLCHFDLYRLEDASELEDVGFYEYVDEATPGACLIEWADLFPDEMPEEALSVHIAPDGGEDAAARLICAKAATPRAHALLEAWEDAIIGGASHE